MGRGQEDNEGDAHACEMLRFVISAAWPVTAQIKFRSKRGEAVLLAALMQTVKCSRRRITRIHVDPRRVRATCKTAEGARRTDASRVDRLGSRNGKASRGGLYWRSPRSDRPRVAIRRWRAGACAERRLDR